MTSPRLTAAMLAALVSLTGCTRQIAEWLAVRSHTITLLEAGSSSSAFTLQPGYDRSFAVVFRAKP